MTLVQGLGFCTEEEALQQEGHGQFPPWLTVVALLLLVLVLVLLLLLFLRAIAAGAGEFLIVRLKNSFSKIVLNNKCR